MSEVIDTDYLVVGAGTAGMAFADSLLTHSDASVTIVDRRHAPGGHWIDAYPFVALHQPSAFYGVSSVPLGQDAITRSGLDAGFYERATADELRAYFSQVMQRHFLPSGRVRYFPNCDYTGGADGLHRITSRLSGATQEVRVRRKLVDAAYVEGSIPAVDPPPFEVAEGVRCVAAGDVARLAGRAERFVVIGAGKTALDTCVFLLTHGVPASSIQWVKPREGWWLNRRFHQPHDLLPDFYAAVGLQLQAMAEAASIDNIFSRLESDGFFLRVDATVTPTMCHGAIVSETELALLRQIEDVVRLGRVRKLEQGRIVLDDGIVPTGDNTVHVNCAARGLARPPLRPIFESGRVTVQPCFWGFASYQFALLGAVEAMVEHDEDKNRFCRPILYWDTNADYLTSYLAAMASEQARSAHPSLAAWAKSTRLNPLAAIGPHRDHPAVVQARDRMKRFGAAAAANAVKLVSANSRASGR